MSTIKDFTEEISDQFLVCKICYQVYDKPKTLSCLHVFCTSCLEKYLQAELERTQYRYVIYARGVTCPICRKRTEITSGGIRDLPDNFLVSNLTELVNRSKPVTKNSMCDFCSNSGRSKVAKSRCVECVKNMCQSCTELHKRTRVTRNHSVFDVKAEKSVVCKVHLDEPLRFFCQPCETCICVACTFREHQGHEVSSFGEGIQKYAGDMEAMISLCSSKIATIQTQLDVINRFEARMNRVEEHIKSLASNLIVNIRMKQRTLLDEIRQFYGSEALELLDNREELEQILDNLSSTCDLAQFVLKDRNVELLLLHKEVREKMKTLIDCDLPDLPDTMFKDLKFIHGAMFFGYLDSGQELRQLEYDVKPSPLLPPEILSRLSVTSCIEETQTSIENVRECGTSMDCDVVNKPPSVGSQTDEPLRLLRRGSTQTDNACMKSTGTGMDIPIFRSRSQNTERPDVIFANCASQTNVELIDSLSQCHPVLLTNGIKETKEVGTDTQVKTSSVACDTGITKANCETTTEDLETELINKYLEMLDSDEPHSPPYNIPFPVDIFDRHSPTSETMPILSHLLNSVQKVDQGTNVPSVTDITGGREIEFMDVMVKDSSTNTDDLLPKFTDNPIYTYSDSFEESSPEDCTDSSDYCRSSDEEKIDQSTLVDRDDLIQLLAGEALVNWDERSALHDMIVLDRLNQRRNIDYIDSCMNTESIPLASRSVMTDTRGSRTVATITVANIKCDAGVNARVRRPPRETTGTLTDLVQYHDAGNDARVLEMVDFGSQMRPETSDMETEWQDILVHSLSEDYCDFVRDEQPSSESMSKRKPSLETSELTEKLQGLFSMSKLQELTQKLERRPSQTAGLVSAVTRKLERQMSGEKFDDESMEAFTETRKKPVRRWSTSGSFANADHQTSPTMRSRKISDSSQSSAASKPTPLLRASKDIKIHPSPPSSPKQKTHTRDAHSFHTQRLSPLAVIRSKTHSYLSKFDGETASVTVPDDKPKTTTGMRKQLARVRKPDITALLSLNTLPIGDWGPVLPKRSSSFQATRKYQLTSQYRRAEFVENSKGEKSTESSSMSGKDISSDSSMESSSDFSSSLDEAGTPILTPFTDDSQSPIEGRSGTVTPVAEWNIEVHQNSSDGEPLIQVREILNDTESSIDEPSEDDSNRRNEVESYALDASEGRSADHDGVSEKQEFEATEEFTKDTDCSPRMDDETENANKNAPLKCDTELDSRVNEHNLVSLPKSKDIAANRMSVCSDNFEEIERLMEAESKVDTSPTVEVSPGATAEMMESGMMAQQETGQVMSVPVSVPIATKHVAMAICDSPKIEIETSSPPKLGQLLSGRESEISSDQGPETFEYEETANLAPLRRPQISPRSPNRTRRFTYDELPSLSESEVLDYSNTYRSLSPRPKMGKMPSVTPDQQIRREEAPRVVLGVSGIGAIPRSKSLNTIEAKDNKQERSDKKSLGKALQSLFKSKKDSKVKRNSSFM